MIGGILFGAILTPPVRASEGISTPFVDIQVSGVVPGKAQELLDLPTAFRIRNLGSSPLRVVVQTRSPRAPERLGDAEAIPDPRWLVVQPDTFALGPHQEMECHLEIRVPRKRAFAHRQFQVMLLTQSRPELQEGVALGAGLLSSLRFTTTSLDQ